jgi:malonyl-CoA/methylmalonyl-CoA synthetase
VALAPGASLDEQPVQDALAKQLAKFKLPKRVVFVADLPRNAMSKVQKNVLRETFGDLFDSRAENCS